MQRREYSVKDDRNFELFASEDLGPCYTFIDTHGMTVWSIWERQGQAHISVIDRSS